MHPLRRLNLNTGGCLEKWCTSGQLLRRPGILPLRCAQHAGRRSASLPACAPFQAHQPPRDPHQPFAQTSLPSPAIKETRECQSVSCKPENQKLLTRHFHHCMLKYLAGFIIRYSKQRRISCPTIRIVCKCILIILARLQGRFCSIRVRVAWLCHARAAGRAA